MIISQDIFLQINDQQFMQTNNLEQYILKSEFGFKENIVELALMNNFIILSDKFSSLVYCCQLHFSVKFEVIRAEWKDETTPGKPLGICLEKQNSQSKIQFLSNSEELVNLWASQLQKKINQRNFHKLFKAKRKIGRGAFATVYLAERLIDKKMFAVKAFSKQKQYSCEKGRQSLENEINIMRLLNHQNIIKLQSIYETQNSIYVVMEFIQGLQLNQQIKNQKCFSLQESRIILKGLLNGISHLSSKGIIHRDLKPQNIMFRKKNSLQIAICDFGLATHADQEKYLFVRCGTPGFVAPEIINIKDMSVKSQPISDVFSVGIIFHYLLLNKFIFAGTHCNDILIQNRACQFDFSNQQYETLDAKALDLLIKMLEKRPEARITADQAIKHPFFVNQTKQPMEIQRPQTLYLQNPLKQITSITMKTPSLSKSSKTYTQRKNSIILQYKGLKL